ncbi:MAG TPA: ATPase, partial [Ktedonobacteraceae bacterium]|nr:ATPase [Ktedonobacteraceae bacterium]
MEESTSTSSSDATAANRTTGKLPLENTANNTTSATGNNSDQNQTAMPYDSLQLVVIEGFQVGRGVARIDPSDMAHLGCQPGDIIMITGARSTAAKVVPSAIMERGQQTIQMDSQVRQNSASGLGEHVTVHKAKVKNAEKVTLLPLTGGAPIQ